MWLDWLCSDKSTCVLDLWGLLWLHQQARHPLPPPAWPGWNPWSSHRPIGCIGTCLFRSRIGCVKSWYVLLRWYARSRSHSFRLLFCLSFQHFQFQPRLLPWCIFLENSLSVVKFTHGVAFIHSWPFNIGRFVLRCSTVCVESSAALDGSSLDTFQPVV